MTNNLKTIDLSTYTYNGDPVAWFLLKKLKLKPATISLIAISVAITIHLIIGNLIGVTLFPLKYTYMPSWHEAIQEFILAPLVWYYYAWMPTGISNALNALWKNRVFDPCESYDHFVQEYKGIFKNTKFIPILALPILILVFSVEFSYWETWRIANIPNSLYYFILYGFYMGLGWYFVICMALRELFVVIQFVKIFHNRKVRINLWHPDKKGGLGSLSSYRLNIAVVLTIMALIILIISVPGPYKAPNPSISVPILIIIYLVIGPSFFFVPLFGAHKAMKSAKSSLIKEIAKDLNKYSHQYEDNDDSLQIRKDDPDWELFESRTKLFQIAAEYPEWPIDLRILSRFIFVTLLPILLNILSIFL